MGQNLKSGKLRSENPTLTGYLSLGNNPTLSGMLSMKVARGLSAYDIAVEYGGFEGTETEWLESLKGKQVVLEYDINTDKVYWRYEDSDERNYLFTNEHSYINGVKLSKGSENNNTLDDLGIQPKGNYVKEEDVNFITNEYLDTLWQEWGE